MNGWPEFERRLEERYPGIVIQAEPSLGSANSARFLMNAFKVGIPNLLTRKRLLRALSTNVPWAYVGKVLLPGLQDSEFFVALILSGSNLQALEDRLREIEANAMGATPQTNNTRLLLHQSGFYATVAQEQDRIDPGSENDQLGSPIDVDEVLYADVERSGQLTPGEVDIVHRLKRDYSEPEKVVRLERNGAVVAAVRRPEDLNLDELARRIASLGGYFDRETLETFHLNLIHNPRKHFVILRGISGTGKSRLAKCYAYSVLAADSLDETHERFVVVPIEPQWTDPSFLVGHEDVLADGGYRKTAFLDALILAHSDPMQPVFVLLDEMNRAQVEHYFSNFLSAMEIEGSIRFHSGSTGSIENVPPEIPWPRNLYLIGTVNDDESVLPFSPMVLDRANSQDLSAVDIRGYGRWLRGQMPELANTLSDSLLETLTRASAILEPFQLHFGNRTVREIALYLKSAQATGSTVNALDRQIDQKILPKLKGGGEASRMLEELASLLDDYPISRGRVDLMRSDLIAVDFFKYR